MSKEEQHKDYLQNKINPIMEKLVVDLLVNKPNDVLGFMEKWIKTTGVQIVKEHDKKHKSGKNRNAYGESSEEEGDDEDVEDLVPIKKEALVQPGQKPMRTSVSAEVYGMFNQKGDYKPREIPKTADQVLRIKKRLETAFMFSGLDEKETHIVINAFDEVKFKGGDAVIRQGEDGDNLYVIDQGQLDCYKRFKKDEDEKHLKVYQPGEAFGELALLYNAPRAATIIAKTDCVLFALDRECFNHIVKDAAARKREAYENLLTKIELLDSMDPYERSKIADALKPAKFRQGEYVVRQGDKGDTFYFVEKGEAIATKTMKGEANPITVYEYKEGDYFGELALLKDAPRQANIIAKTDLSCVYLDRQSFKRLLGPLDDILQRNFSRYEKFVN